MRTICLILSFLVCFVLCLSGQSNTSSDAPPVRKKSATFQIVKTPGLDQYEVIHGSISMNKVIINIVTTKEVNTDSRRLASLGNDDTVAYQLEIIKSDIKSFTKNDLKSSSLQLQYVAP